MKKTILFVMPYLNCGGTESAWLSLLGAIPRDEYKITLALLKNSGSFMNRIPDDVEVINISIPEKEQGVFLGKKNQLLDYLKKGKIIKAIQSLIYNSRTTITEDRMQMASYFSRVSDSIPYFPGEYDLAIDYFGYASFTTFYLAEKVSAKIKVSWVHSILSNSMPKAFLPYYKKMDRIFAVSEMVKNDFQIIFPELKNVDILYNIIDPSKIISGANNGEGFDDEYDGLRILTVGRISPEKGQDMAIKALKRIIDDGYKVRWYFVGSGDEDLIKSYSAILSEQERSNSLRFLGIKDNPYPYMKQCDIYVQPSYIEGFCLTTSEAAVLECPIVTTDTCGASEKFIPYETALIVSISEEGIYEGIKQLIENPQKRKELKENLKTVKHNNSKEIDKLLRLIE